MTVNTSYLGAKLDI